MTNTLPIATTKLKRFDSAKVTILSTIATLVAVLYTSFTHVTNGINFFITPDISYDIVRAGAVAILISLLFITAPRSMAMRLFLGLIATVLFAGSIWLLLDYQMLLLDAVVFIAVAIVFCIEALEPERITLAAYLAQTE